VGEDTPLYELLEQFQIGKSHMALVTSKKTQSVVGVITLEDVFEEIVQGDIIDESDLSRSLMEVFGSPTFGSLRPGRIGMGGTLQPQRNFGTLLTARAGYRRSTPALDRLFMDTFRHETERRLRGGLLVTSASTNLVSSDVMPALEGSVNNDEERGGGGGGGREEGTTGPHTDHIPRLTVTNERTSLLADPNRHMSRSSPLCSLISCPGIPTLTAHLITSHLQAEFFSSPSLLLPSLLLHFTSFTHPALLKHKPLNRLTNPKCKKKTLLSGSFSFIYQAL
jgi:hypothetical protein